MRKNKIFQTIVFAFFAILLCVVNVRANYEPSPLEGRWDLVIAKDGKQLPSWLEVQHSGNHTLIGRFVYAFGSARPVAEIKLNGNHFNFAIPVQWEPGN
ncbi:MAG: DUF1080 domain-containing protein, partial [Bacteroidetes bacterium]|nr:DUF1080 domain-containing protein [Bacteroidota bacterium]